jgi:3-deoxy-D-manno-octulosonate 8-phosphate phosphatase KdsC-like HAD superfamily phosphatase
MRRALLVLLANYLLFMIGIALVLKPVNTIDLFGITAIHECSIAGAILTRRDSLSVNASHNAK